MAISDHQAKYFAHYLGLRHPSDSLEKFSTTLSDAQVDLNPHQIEAALFAFSSPVSKGAIFADEVGLGKTIEAGLVIAQRWAEKKRKVLLIVPANLRKQWHQEMGEKFFLPCVIMEQKSFNTVIKGGNLNPFENDSIVICSYHFAKAKAPYLKQVDWDLVVLDEAHRLRNVYKKSNKIAATIKESIAKAPKLLLTATPLQNSLLELYGLVGIVDEHVFGSLESFKYNYSRLSQVSAEADPLASPEQSIDRFADLKERLKQVCWRTLRKEVEEYVSYTRRIPHTEDYYPSDVETKLYEDVSEYLRRPMLYSLPNSQRQLITMVLRKLLGSSSRAIAQTLGNMAGRLGKLIAETEGQTAQAELGSLGLESDFEALDPISEEWIDDEEGDEDESTKPKKKYGPDDLPGMRAEKAELDAFADAARKIFANSKGASLLTSLEKGFKTMEELGGARKAVIFSESRETQEYLRALLEENGHQGKVVIFNGTNTDPQSKKIYEAWIEKHKDSDKISGSRTADTRAALIDHFRENAEILIATEAGAEGINLQFCSIVINYDLPWNPQRIEQRIGRCHRYGQKHDVVVINFINRRNAADQRIYELLDEKFNLFKGVFGASDEVLGTIASGVDFEKRIATIYQTCRTPEEINQKFDELRKEMEVDIEDNMRETRRKLLEHVDIDVASRFKMTEREGEHFLDQVEALLWQLAKHLLGASAEYASEGYSFTLKGNPFPDDPAIQSGPYRIGRGVEEAHLFRPNSKLAQRLMSDIKAKTLERKKLTFDYSGSSLKSAEIERELLGKSGSLLARKVTVDSLESQERIVLAARLDDGGFIDMQALHKMLTLLPCTSETAPSSANIPGLAGRAEELESAFIAEVEGRNGKAFEIELDKLDRWERDGKETLARSVKDLERDISILKREVRTAPNLPEKLRLQKTANELEKKLHEQEEALRAAKKDIERRKAELVSTFEARLGTSVAREDIVSIDFEVK